MWCLDEVNSPELMAGLPARPTVRARRALGRRGLGDLVAGCHERLVAEFPDYELLAVRQKWGVLAYQAFPHPWAPGERRWTAAEHERLDAVTEELADRSATVCEWCGAGARLRDAREYWLTLCDTCDDRIPDPPGPTVGRGSG